MTKMLSEADLYNDAYFLHTRDDPRRSIAYALDAQKIRARTSNDLSVLDIGGGYGEFGKYLDCEYYCYDPFTLKNTIPATKFSVVVFRGVLQHIYNPVEMLAKGKDHLGPGGLLAILATPDTDSIGYLRWGTLPALDAPRNWIPFGHKMLENILVRLGLRDIEFLWPYGSPYANPLKNVYNFIIGKPDAFPGNMMECFARNE